MLTRAKYQKVPQVKCLTNEETKHLNKKMITRSKD